MPRYHNSMRNKPENLGERTSIITNSATYWKQRFLPNSKLPEKSIGFQIERAQTSISDKYE